MCVLYILTLRTARRRFFAGADRGSRVLQIGCNALCERVRAAEHAPRGPFRVLERRRGLAEIVERSGGVLVDRLSCRPVFLLAAGAICKSFEQAGEGTDL